MRSHLTGQNPQETQDVPAVALPPPVLRPPLPPSPEPQDAAARPRVNRVFGATSGPYQGNVRAILALLLTSAFLLILGYATVEYIHNAREPAHDFVVGGFGALVAAFTGFTGFYLGKRAAETSG